MKAFLVSMSLILFSLGIQAQKTLYIPPSWSNSTDDYYNRISATRSYQSANFVIYWGDAVGLDPTTATPADRRFNPKGVCDTLEKIYTKYITEIGFCSDAPTTNLGKYKIIIVMLGTFGATGPQGFAFGGTYDGVIGAMWVDPSAVKDGGAISHELTHSLQGMIAIQENKVGGGYGGSDIAGFFWETHTNYMRSQMYPIDAPYDIPSWLGTSSFHWSSTRHHYDAFKLLHLIQEVDGIVMINRMWKESVANEHPLMTYPRLKGWTQAQLNDFLFKYAQKEVTNDYPVLGVGALFKKEIDNYKANQPHYLWRLNTILTQINATLGRYVVKDEQAPQDYGYNMIPLYTTCASKSVTIKFKGHAEVNTTAGWRYGFVAVKADGTVSRYSTFYNANESEVSFQLITGESQMYFVVFGAPTTHTSYAWEAGWPKIKRYPYELTIANAVPEGYQTTYRSEYKTKYPGKAHSNGGSWVTNTATVVSTAYVGPKAMVLGYSKISGNARIDDYAWVENSTVQDNAIINGNTNIVTGTHSGTSLTTGFAVMEGCTVSGNAIVKGNALEFGVTFSNNVIVGGDADNQNCKKITATHL